MGPFDQRTLEPTLDTGDIHFGPARENSVILSERSESKDPEGAHSHTELNPLSPATVVSAKMSNGHARLVEMVAARRDGRALRIGALAEG